MPPEAIAAALLSALINAGWNAALRSGSHRLVDVGAMGIGGIAFGVLLLAWRGLPAPSSWAYLALSAPAHFAYWVLARSRVLERRVAPRVHPGARNGACPGACRRGGRDRRGLPVHGIDLQRGADVGQPLDRHFLAAEGARDGGPAGVVEIHA